MNSKKGLITLVTCLFAAGSIPVALASAQVNLDSGLVAYWSFDDSTATDNSGNGHDGTIYDATPVLGVHGQALDFDGINNYVEVDNAPDLNPPNAITLVAWYRPDSSMGQGSGNDPIIDKGFTEHSNPFYQYHLGIDNWGWAKKFTFEVAAGGSRIRIYTQSGFWKPGC